MDCATTVSLGLMRPLIEQDTPAHVFVYVDSTLQPHQCCWYAHLQCPGIVSCRLVGAGLPETAHGKWRQGWRWRATAADYIEVQLLLLVRGACLIPLDSWQGHMTPG